MDAPRRTAAFLILSCFLLYFFAYGAQYSMTLGGEMQGGVSQEFAQDFSKYLHMKTLSATDIGLDDPSRRIMLVGDIHGMNNSLHDLLSSISYNTSTDTLFHTGDILQKGPMAGSLAVLDFLSSHRIYGVRGNHDQEVIQWRSWVNWIEGLKGGREWLHQVESIFQTPGLDKEEVQNMKKRKGKWWSKLPKGWEMFGEHYKIARQITDVHYRYLLSLPLVLHIPSQHMYLVHGGLLPYNPKRPVDHPKQPLAHLPMPSRIIGTVDEEAMRIAQEIELLTKVPQNMDPWVVLNVRSVTKAGTISRQSRVGTPWTKLWNKTVNKCSGFGEALKKGKKHNKLPCLPSTVVYGHTASRGLDVKRWSVGLDSGCAHGQRLTALVISGADLASLQSRSIDAQVNLENDEYPRRTFVDEEEEDDEDDEDNRDEDDDDRPDWHDSQEEVKPPKDATKIPFGDDGVGRLYSVECHVE